MNKKMLFIPTLILMAMLGLAACTAGNVSLNDTNWKMVSYGPVDNQVLAATGVETSLKFGTDGKVGGNLGCNSFGGEFTLKGDQVTFGLLNSTLMACPDPQMSQESAAFAVLTGTVKVSLVGDTLTILDASGKNELVFARQ